MSPPPNPPPKKKKVPAYVKVILVVTVIFVVMPVAAYVLFGATDIVWDTFCAMFSSSRDCQSMIAEGDHNVVFMVTGEAGMREIHITPLGLLVTFSSSLLICVVVIYLHYRWWNSS